MSAVHPANYALVAWQRAALLARAAHRESYGCSSCGHVWFVRIGVNRLPIDPDSTRCPRCGSEGEP